MPTIAHLSDLHFGRLDEPVAAALVEHLREVPVDLTVISGDFTQRAFASQYRSAAAFRSRLPSPQIVVPGNHDVPLWNLVARTFDPMRAYCV
jgi:3',5'-cyclic AMP phosphodiesterase CpdA